MDLKVIPIINVALPAGPAIIPFYYVEIITEEGKKTLLVNYTFGEVHHGEGMNEPVLEYETKMGNVKEELFHSIKPFVFTQVMFLEGSIENLASQILGHLQNARDHMKLLFVWKRGDIDDVPFFRALKLDPDTAELKMLSDLGLEVGPPFIEIPRHMLGNAEVVQVKPKRR